ncbi:MAG: hypothetical protein AAFQ51_16080 [Pseudomonadota bacterium]
MTPRFRIIGGICGLALVGVLLYDRGWAIRRDILAMEMAAFGAMFFGWWVYSALRDLRRAATARRVEEAADTSR